MTPATTTSSTLIPCLRYRDAQKAIEWLCSAFGFARHAVYADGAHVHHAQLTFGSGMLMLSSVDTGSDWGTRMAQPDETDGRATQSICVVVADVDAHYARASAAGARILVDIADQDYGGRGYSCSDPEGHLWWFGSYDPWQTH